MKIHISRRESKCALGEEPFSEGSTYFSVLSIVKTSFERKDYCKKCFSKQQMEQSSIVWQGKIPHKKPLSLSPDEKTLKLFYTLLADKESEPKHIFILAQLLLRKKFFFRLRAHEYENAFTGEVHHVKEFILKREEAAQLAAELKEMWDGSVS